MLEYAIRVLEQMGLPYMVVGSVASSAYGEPRFTLDIDIVIELREEQVDEFCAAFPPNEFYVSRDAVLGAIRQTGQFNVLHPESGTKVDFMMARADAWGREQLARRRRRQLTPHCEAYAAGPEDIIIAKLLYYREGGSEKHLRDITGILKIRGQEVDRSYVARWAAELGVVEIWEHVLGRLGSG